MVLTAGMWGQALAGTEPPPCWCGGGGGRGQSGQCPALQLLPYSWGKSNQSEEGRVGVVNNCYCAFCCRDGVGIAQPCARQDCWGGRGDEGRMLCNAGGNGRH